MNRFDDLNTDVLCEIKGFLFTNCEEFDEIEDGFRYICFQIFKKELHNYNGDYKREFHLDYIGLDGNYNFD